jgi:hypothetical protein
MAENKDKQADKLEFTSEGEPLGYISLNQARIQAMEHARNDTDFCGGQYNGIGLVWEVCRAQESDGYYDIRLSFRPSGRFLGEPGVEQFVIEKNGDLRTRQILDEPTAIEMPRRWRLSLIVRLTLIVVIGGVAAIAGFATSDSDKTLKPSHSTSVPINFAGEKEIITHVPLVEEIVAEKDSGQHRPLPAWPR